MELNELDRYRDRDDLRLDELVDIANSFVELVAPEQPSDRVAERLNERTLRYYITKGLVDRPSGKEGAAALYSYRHLLQILALKSLQASYFPIKRIKEVLAGKSNDELKIILAGEPQERVFDVRQKAISYLDSLLSDGRDDFVQRSDVDLHALPKERKKTDRWAFTLDEEGALDALALEEDIDSAIDELFEDSSAEREVSDPKQELSPRLSPLRRRRAVYQSPAVASWERFTLDDGVELHIRSDRVGRLRGSEVRRIAERILNLLKHRSARRKKRR
jgi:DNA-binding transcriptional MerR regulator